MNGNPAQIYNFGYGVHIPFESIARLLPFMPENKLYKQQRALSDEQLKELAAGRRYKEAQTENLYSTEQRERERAGRERELHPTAMQQAQANVGLTTGQSEYWKRRPEFEEEELGIRRSVAEGDQRYHQNYMDVSRLGQVIEALGRLPPTVQVLRRDTWGMPVTDPKTGAPQYDVMPNPMLQQLQGYMLQKLGLATGMGGVPGGAPVVGAPGEGTEDIARLLAAAREKSGQGGGGQLAPLPLLSKFTVPGAAMSAADAARQLMGAGQLSGVLGRVGGAGQGLNVARQGLAEDIVENAPTLGAQGLNLAPELLQQVLANPQVLQQILGSSVAPPMTGIATDPMLQWLLRQQIPTNIPPTMGSGVPIRR